MIKHLLLSLVFMLIFVVNSKATIRYIKPVATGSGDGSSWANASDDLSWFVQAPFPPGDEIWVASGTYLPNRKPNDPFLISTDPRDVAFYLKDGIKLYGGFAGTETNINQRNIAANITILSGNIGIAAVDTDNCYHVVVSSSTNSTDSITIDGFTITAGNANNQTNSFLNVYGNLIPKFKGGGIYKTVGVINLSNSIISNNIALQGGGGLYSENASNIISKNTFHANTVWAKGCGIYINGGVNTISNNTISNNVGNWNGGASVGSAGGGIYCEYSNSTTISNNTIINNLGGGIDCKFGEYNFNNNTISGNSAAKGGGIIINNTTNTNTLITNNTIFDNTATNYGGGICFENSQLVSADTNIMSNNIFWGNKKAGSSTDFGADFYDYDINGISTNIFTNNLLQMPASFYLNATSNALNVGSANNLFNIDPLFVNDADIDGADNLHRTADDGLRLQTSSPAENSGANTGVASLDITGATRIQSTTVDIGAYEGGIIVCSTNNTINLSICSGNSYTFNGVALTTSGTYKDTLINAALCDSIVTLNLNVNTTPSINGVTASSSSICEGNSSTLVVSVPQGGVMVSTLAGAGFSGNGNGIGTAASFSFPAGMATDAIGNVYVADYNNHLIRKINTVGEVTTLAGNGSIGNANYIGIFASFNNPRDVATDAKGNVYVADAGNHLIRKINIKGTVTTLAGSGTMGSANGMGTSAAFNSPESVATDDSGNVYVADAGNHLIRKISPTGIVTTFAGSGSVGSADGMGTAASFYSPSSIDIDALGNLYVADKSNHIIRKISPLGMVTTIAGTASITGGFANGTGASASFNLPSGIATDVIGNVYVTDLGNHLIRKLSPAGVVTTLAGLTGTSGSANGAIQIATFNFPNGIATDATGNVFVADYSNHLIRKIDGQAPNYSWSPSVNTLNINDTTLSVMPNATTIYTVTATTVGGCTVASTINVNVNPKPLVTATATSTSVCVGSTDTLQATGAFMYTWNGIPTTGSDTILSTLGVNATYTVVGTDANGCTNSSTVAITVSTNPTITSVTANPSTICTGNSSTLQLTAPPLQAMVSTLAGTSYQSGSMNATGTAASFSAPLGVATDNAGNVYVADYNNHLIRKINSAGIVTTFAGSGSGGSNNGIGTNASFFYPNGIATDAAGNVYVADFWTHIIRKITPAGVVTTLAGQAGVSGSVNGTGTNATFNYPNGIATDDSGNVYVAEPYNDLIRKITPAGVVTTFAGSGFSGSTNGIGIAASFYRPTGVAIDTSGNVYVADSYNHLIRKITPAGEVTTLAGTAGISGSVNGTGTTATFNKPFGIVTDSSGNVYITEENNHLIRKITSSGVVTTLAGTVGSPGNTNGLGNSASFHTPRGIAADNAGNLYVANQSSHEIRKIVLPKVQSYAWSPAVNMTNSSNDTVSVLPTSNTVYTVTASTSPVCTVTSTVLVVSNSTSNLAQASALNAQSTSGNSSQTYTQNDGTTYTYANGSCNVIATIQDGIGGNILGSTFANVIVDASVQTYNGQPYIRRHYSITPTNQGPATITLYLTQADFNDYNINNGTWPDLPTNSTDLLGINRLRITKVNGVLGVGAAEVITPTLVWNATNMYWTATFPVTSFSSFYFHAANPSNAPLPVTLLTFTGNKEVASNVLHWVTSMEQNNAYFNLQHSIDAKNYITIATIPSQAPNGNSLTTIDYSAYHNTPSLGHNYYRLEHVDIDGNHTICSSSIDLYWSANGSVVTCYPNPTSAILNIDLYAVKDQYNIVKLLDVTGRVVKQIQTKSLVGMNNIKLSLQELISGIYTIQLYEGNTLTHTSRIKKE